MTPPVHEGMASGLLGRHPRMPGGPSDGWPSSSISFAPWRAFGPGRPADGRRFPVARCAYGAHDGHRSPRADCRCRRTWPLTRSPDAPRSGRSPRRPLHDGLPPCPIRDVAGPQGRWLLAHRRGRFGRSAKGTRRAQSRAYRGAVRQAPAPGALGDPPPAAHAGRRQCRLVAGRRSGDGLRRRTDRRLCRPARPALHAIGSAATRRDRHRPGAPRQRRGRLDRRTDGPGSVVEVVISAACLVAMPGASGTVSARRCSATSSAAALTSSTPVQIRRRLVAADGGSG